MDESKRALKCQILILHLEYQFDLSSLLFILRAKNAIPMSLVCIQECIANTLADMFCPQNKIALNIFVVLRAGVVTCLQ